MVKPSTFLVHLIAFVVFTTQSIGSVVAFDKASNVDEFTIKNHRTRMRQNYVLHKATNNAESDDMNDLGLTYASTRSIQSDTIPEQLPALMVDYANMIRNDIVLLDDTVQTRTRKRGSVKTEKQQSLEDVPCSCEEDGKKLIFLGEDYVPRILETRHCNKSLCPAPYGCSFRSHNVTVLKRKKYLDELSQEDLPEELKRRWVAEKKPVIVGCTCSEGYIDRY